ncbi:MAG: MFS transporter [Endozoicomonas sp. (ex Botrylloides leachii)]|nr:MFS transporter [Endozoicomonas sp. (ex Botrylloides leachii)]
MAHHLKLKVITTLSATLEFYDFTLLIFLAQVFAVQFFPEISGVSGIMPVLMIFFAGYLARFVGGVWYGHGGDTGGRKHYYMYSIILMSISTLGIALLPSYNSWGIMAPLSLLLLRVLQGLSLGGEIPGAVVYAAEYSENHRRGFATGLVVSGVTLGNVLASLVVSLLFNWFGNDAVYEWAWRLAFGMGSILGLISLWVRFSLQETPVYATLPTRKKRLWPSIHIIKTQKLSLLRGLFLSGVPAVVISTLFFMPRYQTYFLHIPEQTTFKISTLAFFLLAVMALVMAIISDKIGRLLLIRFGSLALGIIFPLCIAFLVDHQLSPFMALLPVIIASSMIMGVYEVAMLELFATEIRYSGIGICHNLGFCLFGGLTPLFLEWLCEKGYLLAPGIWVGLISIGLFVLTYRWQDKYRHTLIAI